MLSKMKHIINQQIEINYSLFNPLSVYPAPFGLLEPLFGVLRCTAPVLGHQGILGTVVQT